MAGLQNLIRTNYNQLDQKINEVEARLASRLDKLQDALLTSAETGAELHKRQAEQITSVQGAVGPVIEALRDQLQGTREDLSKLSDGMSGVKLNPQASVAVSVCVPRMT